MITTDIAKDVMAAQDEAGVPLTADDLGTYLSDAIHDAGYRLVPLADLPSEAHARRTDGAESWDAARSIEDLNRRQAAVRLQLKRGPATDEELTVRYAEAAREESILWSGDERAFPDQTLASLRTRRAELVAAGLVRATGETRPTRSGRQAQVWAVTD